MDWPLFEQTWIPWPKDNLCQIWLKWVQWSWRRFYNVINFRYFTTIPLGARHNPSFVQTCIEFRFTEGCFLPRNWLKLVHLFLKRYLNVVNVPGIFTILPLSPTWKRAWSFFWTNLNSLHLRILFAKFGWSWPSDSGKEYENVKSLQTDEQINDERHIIKKAHLSSQYRHFGIEKIHLCVCLSPAFLPKRI